VYRNTFKYSRRVGCGWGVVYSVPLEGAVRKIFLRQADALSGDSLLR
jgi:hypothetical protein